MAFNIIVDKKYKTEMSSKNKNIIFTFLCCTRHFRTTLAAGDENSQNSD